MPNSDLISRDAAKKIVSLMVCAPTIKIAAEHEIDDLPAIDAAPERHGYVRVTRCKNCKRWEYGLDFAPIGKGTCLDSLLWTKPDDYYSRGERADAPTCGPDYCEIGGWDDES